MKKQAKQITSTMFVSERRRELKYKRIYTKGYRTWFVSVRRRELKFMLFSVFIRRRFVRLLTET